MSLKSPSVFKVVLISIASLLITMPAFAGLFYVRTDGNDANSGLENTPSGAWATIQKAADTLNPADTVEVQAGTYNEQVTITRSGLANQLITFHANGEVIIDGQSTRPYCIKLDGADYIKINGFTVRNATDNGILLDNTATYNIISNNTCHNNGASGIRLNTSSNYNLIAGNTCYSNGAGTSAYGDRSCGVYLFNSSNYNTLDSNICRNNPSTGIWLEGSSSYCTIKNNKAYSNGYGGIIIVGGTNYNTVSYNLIYSNGQFGMDVSYSAHDNVIKNNTIYNHGTNGIQSNNNGYSNYLRNNIIFNNARNNSWAGIWMDSGCSAISTYNNIYNNGNNGNRNYGGVAIQGAGDISLDPLFKSTDSSSADFLKLKSLAVGDTVESPCIDSGDPNDTPSSQSGKRIDIGAYDLYSHAPIQGGLLAEYFDNQNLTSLKLVKIEPRINFSWGYYSPDASIGQDTFSIRWQGQIKIDFAQAYTFYITTDDGSRLYIDNNLIINKWYDQGTTEHSATINLTPGLHDIRYEYYENGGGAVAKLYWSSPSINKSLIPSDHLYYFGQYQQDQSIQGGLKGTYNKFTSLYGSSSYVFTRVDPQINFDWGSDSPDASLGVDTYQARWKGKIRIPIAATYTFYTITDDGVRLWVNNQLLVDAWRDQGATEYSGSLSLAPGLYDIELDYYEDGGGALCKLFWSSSTITKSVIPPTNLYYQKDDYIEGGLLAEYFDNKDVTNPKIKRIDPNIDFDWQASSPDPLIQADTFSIRWTGQVKADYGETYTFFAASDDGLKLWVDNQLLISTWWDHGAQENSASINLTVGWHDIKVEYYENTGLSSVKLAYSSASTPKTIIPRDHLRTTPLTVDASLNFYSTLNSAQDIQTPQMGHSASIIQTGTGQVTFEWAKFGKGALLNGTTDGNNDELISFSSADLNKKEGTIEFWFKPNWNSDDGIWHRFLCSTYNWDGCIEIFKYSNNSLYFKIVKEGVQHCIVSGTSRMWSAGTWHHLAFSYGPAGMKFYLDYQPLPISWTFHGEAPYTGPMPDIFASDLYLGGTYWGENPPDAIFDDVKIYNKQIVPSDTMAPRVFAMSHQNNQVVSSSPITIAGYIDDNTAAVTINGVPAATVGEDAFTSLPIDLVLGPNTITIEATDQSNNKGTHTLNIRLTNLTGLWHVDENQGATVYDTTAYHNNGTIYSAVWAPGISNSALQFDGTNDYLRINDSTSLNELGKQGSSYSIALWFKTSVRKSQSLTEKWPSTGGPYPWCIRGPVTSSGKIVFALYDGTNNPGIWSLSSLDDSKWHYLVGVRDTAADRIRLYIDGVLNAESIDSTVGNINNTYNVIIGQRHGTGTDAFSGLIDEVKIYDRVLTSQEILDDYLWFDKTPPTGTVVINDNNQYTTSREVTLTLSATDDLSGVSMMQFSNDGENWLPVPAANYATTYPWTLSDTDGTKRVYARFRDVAGNWMTPPYPYDEIVLDTTAPTVPAVTTVVSPTNINTQNLSGTKEANSSILINGIERVPLDSQTTWSKVVNLSEGTNNFSITSKDAAGNESQPPVEVSIILDTIAPAQPTINTLTSPTNITSQTITGTKSEDTATIKVTCSSTATPDEPTYPTSTTWSCHLTNLAEGANDITVVAEDAAGNDSPTASGTIVLDTIAPAQPTIDPVTSPTDINYQTITGTKSEDTATIEVICLTVTVGEVTYPTSTTWSCPLTNLSVGDNDITVTAFDIVENPSIPRTTTISYQPQTGLTVKITSPAEGARRVNTQPITISGTVSDSTATVRINGVYYATVTNNTFTVSGIPLTAGTNIITARATKDTETAEDIINVILDQDPPSINIYTPDTNATTRSNIVYGRVSDDTQSVTVNGTPAEILPDFRFIGRPTLTEGANTITVQAQDQATNTNQASVNITYNTQTPKVTITSPLDSSTQNISPINVQGTNTEDLSFIMVNSATALIDTTNFTAQGVALDTTKSVITATGYDATDSKFQDAIVVNSPDFSHYELIKISGDIGEDDPDRPSAGSGQILKVKVEKNGLVAPSEEVQFSVTQGAGTVSPASIFTDINGEAQVTLTTDTNSDITNEVQCYPTNNPLVKIAFYVDTKPAVPSTLTKITDDTVTPVPGATIPLIVKLTDSNNNPIQDETINFQVISGGGTLSSPTAITTYYGEAKVDLTCPNLGLVLTQIQASSSTVPSVAVTFNITTSAPLTVTVQDIIDKVNYNDSKIQDIKADISVTSNVAWSSPTAQLKIWIKGDKQKIEEVSPNPGVYIRPVIEGTINMNKEIISYDTTPNIYVIKIKKQGQTDEYPYILHHIDYAKGIIVKAEYHILQNDYKTTTISEYSDFIQINEAWGYQKQIDRTYGQGGQLLDTTTKIYSNIQINTGILDGEFQ